MLERCLNRLGQRIKNEIMSEMFSLKISSTINDTVFYFLSDSRSNGNVCNYL